MATVPERDAAPVLGPGIYFAEVKDVEERISKKGDDMLSLTLRAPDFDAHICYDQIMLTGGGAGIGSSKLGAFGLEPKEEFDPVTLIGKRVYVAIVAGEFDGKKRLEVDIRAEGSHCGYWSEDEAPDGVMTKEGEIDVPF